MKAKILTLSFSMGAILTGMLDLFISEIYQFLAITLVVFLDAIFGIAKAILQGNFQTNKSFKFIFMLTAFCFLLATVLVIEKGYPVVSFLSEAILIPIIVFELISIVKNMHILGLISSQTLGNILSKIDKHKNI